jgi:hypothetical protein
MQEDGARTASHGYIPRAPHSWFTGRVPSPLVTRTDAGYSPLPYAQALALRQDWLRSAASGGTIDNYAGKRLFPRVTWRADLIVRICDGRLEGLHLQARARNISLGGVGVVTRAPIPAGAAVTVALAESLESVSGSVVHCTKIIQGFLVGISWCAPD